MTFLRTEGGLSSEHLFYDVDWVVYCEGKPHLDSPATLDEVFWTKTLSANDVRCKCKSLGSKSDLSDIVDSIVNGHVDSVLVAMDRDYDHLNGKLINHPRVLYTNGYSWESDVCEEFATQSVIQLFVNMIDCDSLITDFYNYKTGMSAKLKRTFALDFKYHNHSEKLFDRGKPMSIIDMNNLNTQYIRQNVLVQSAKNMAKHQPFSLSRAYYNSACGLRDFFGKTIAKLIYQWFVKKTAVYHQRRNIPYETVMMTMIQSMDMGTMHIYRNQHHNNQNVGIV